MSESNPARDALIARIKKLEALSQCAGATEAEALAAGQKMAELIAEHNVQATELTLRRDAKGCAMDFLYLAQSERSNWQLVCFAIGNLFKVKVYRKRHEVDLLGLGFTEKVVAIHFFGFLEDVAAAKAMLHLIELACHAEIAKWIKTPRGRNTRNDFELAMANRLTQRIEAMIEPAKVSNSRALLVLKDQLVDDEWARYMQEHDIKVKFARVRSVKGDSHAIAHGEAAAERVNLSRGTIQRTLIGG